MEPSTHPTSFHASARDDNPVASGKVVNKRYLANKLNYLNFQDQTILIQLRHSRYDTPIALKAKPLPCVDEHLECEWVETPNLQQLLNAYDFDYLLIPDGQKLLLVNPKVISMNERGITLLLPVNGREFTYRRIRRYPGTDITAQFTQNSSLFHGTMVDFTPVSLRVNGSTDFPQEFQWINHESAVNLHLYAGQKILYSGECEIMRQNFDQNRSFVLSPVNNSIRVIKPKQYRNIRQQLVPSPSMVFEHPLIGKMINLKVLDLSGSGFAVEESEENSVLMPGMVIPVLELSFAHSLSVTCKAQVVSRNIIGNGGRERLVRCGLSILDMDIHEHVKLLSILHQAADQNSFVCTDVDMDALWDFFFETGFIYPEKYAYFQANKDDIKATYSRLYGQNPHIARHFIYLERGTIQGHMAMVRFYEDSWLIHHHAARKTSLKAGLTVLNQVGQYLNELQNLHFTHLHYVYCYFRPDNHFPNRIFGEFARQLNNRAGCSLDTFGYFHYHSNESEISDLPEGWELGEATSFDLTELKGFYNHVSGGLMIQAFDLHPPLTRGNKLAEEYHRLGFKKERLFYALREEGNLRAFVIANITDAGFNMANLTNCVTVIALEEEIPPEILKFTLHQISQQYEGHEMPVLVYPFTSIEEQSAMYEKTYLLWILDLAHSDDYFRFCDNLFKSRKRIQE
ncbi:pilus assembly protein PilZ [Pelotalea chapellei]|uniref:Pilus assembly protein PilZ n=1 Tax=Pelotalea chapellei TaxID=44671 RepID=A0ABS5UBX7_9BACT|nr:pilus assembly protein PilZ [Pelotalea chapellei]MBT1073196.1 pilus assembly protein PilZ [Pelotalea chapellei]